MDTLSAFARGQANRGKPLMVFDWDKAARLIKEKSPTVVSAGLRDDWEWTGGLIYKNHEIVEDGGTYLASTWAVPEIMIDGEVESCYIMESENKDWNAYTVWPDSAKNILKANGNLCD